MLINDNDLEKRLNNPLNLINRMNVVRAGKSSLDLFVGKKESSSLEIVPKIKPFVSPFSKKEALAEVVPIKEESSSSVEVLNSLDNNSIELAIAHDKSVRLMTKAIDQLDRDIERVKAEKLPSVITGLAKVVEGIRKEKLERERDGDKENVHFHFYCPEPRKLETYEVIDV